MVTKLNKTMAELDDDAFDERWRLINSLMELYVPENLRNDAWNALHLGYAEEGSATCVRNIIELINVEERKGD